LPYYAAIMNTIDYFASRSEPDSSGCWLWRGATNHNGYGVMLGPGRKTVRAHRRCYEVAKGEIGAGLEVCHTCDVPRCVNPDHLWLGTGSDNALDKTRKGRNPIVALNDFQVREIRQSKDNTNALARRYGVGWNAVQNARDGRTYRHVK
jgi:hypothetical protein